MTHLGLYTVNETAALATIFNFWKIKSLMNIEEKQLPSLAELNDMNGRQASAFFTFFK